MPFGKRHNFCQASPSDKPTPQGSKHRLTTQAGVAVKGGLATACNNGGVQRSLSRGVQASGGQTSMPSPETPQKRQGATLGSAPLVKQRADNKTTRRQLGVLREASTLNGWKHDPHFVGSGGASPSERDTTGECNVALVKIGMVVPMHILQV